MGCKVYDAEIDHQKSANHCKKKRWRCDRHCDNSRGDNSCRTKLPRTQKLANYTSVMERELHIWTHFKLRSVMPSRNKVWLWWESHIWPIKEYHEGWVHNRLRWIFHLPNQLLQPLRKTGNGWNRWWLCEAMGWKKRSLQNCRRRVIDWMWTCWRN